MSHTPPESDPGATSGAANAARSSSAARTGSAAGQHLGAPPHSSRAERRDERQHTSLKRTLGIPTLVVFGLAYLVPMTVFTTYGIVNETTNGYLAAAYVITLIAVLFTALSYATMSREVASAGSAYAYARAGFGSRIGFLTGWAVLMDYVLLPMLNYLLIGVYLHEQFPAVPGWVFAMAGLVLVTALNIVGISAVKGANVVIVALQVVFFVVFFFFAARSFDPSVSLLDPFFRGDFALGPVVAGSAVLCLSFLGFDAISTMAEEAKDPQRTVPRAIILTTVLAGVFFVMVAWVCYMVFPQVITGDGADSAALTMLAHVGGNLLTALFLAAYVTGAMGSALASQASVSRILFSMGRDGVIPKRVFGFLSRRFRTPVGAILVVAVISVSAAFADVDFVASIVSFGALTAFTVVNLAVIMVFLVRRSPGRGAPSLLRHGLFPAIGFGFTVWLWTSLTGITLLVGLAWIAIGLLYLLWFTRGFRRPVPSMEID
ncbi:APC family permease [Brevibacterium sp. BRM-1]|uniref:APC family permease n=1 Tax=Brevibacterium sp. BRM-1 TaxID=2999062 RepID=UPI00227E02BF|nr:APC family permease [Brevibacterium sp. BRM-1]WAL39631.1 APC family permease [Brevibacterium sp. BRM-1]